MNKLDSEIFTFTIFSSEDISFALQFSAVLGI